MSGYSEKKSLLENEEENEEEPVPPYYEATQHDEPAPTTLKDGRPENAVLGYLYDHRARIPGYGLVKMVMVLNQLDRYTLPIVTTSAGYDLHYGDKSCMKNKTLSDELVKSIDDYNLTDYYKNCTAGEIL